MGDKEERSKIERQRVKYWNLRRQIDLSNKMKPEVRLNLCDDLFKEMKIGSIFSPSDMVSLATMGLDLALICNQHEKICFYIQQLYESAVITHGADNSTTKRIYKMKQAMQNEENCDFFAYNFRNSARAEKYL